MKTEQSCNKAPFGEDRFGIEHHCLERDWASYCTFDLTHKKPFIKGMRQTLLGLSQQDKSNKEKCKYE